jgi:hypothetical protein
VRARLEERLGIYKGPYKAHVKLCEMWQRCKLKQNPGRSGRGCPACPGSSVSQGSGRGSRRGTLPLDTLVTLRHTSHNICLVIARA